MAVHDFEDLTVWQKAMDLAVEVYRLTERFPPDERYNLTSQLRRAAGSVSANIAEGNGRGGTRDYVNFLSHSRGSLNETRSRLILSHRLGFISKTELATATALMREVGRMLTALRRSLQKRIKDQGLTQSAPIPYSPSPSR